MADDIITPEFKQEIKELGGNVKALITKSDEAKKTAEQASLDAKAAKQATEDFVKSIKVISDATEAKRIADEANQKALDTLITEFKMMREGGMRIKTSEGPSFQEEFAELVTKNHDKLLRVSKGQKFVEDMSGNAHMLSKTAPANMTTSGSLSGQGVVTFMPKPALLPGQKINVRDLVTSFQSATTTINLFRESNPSPAVGNFGQQSTEGAIKNQIQYNYSNVAFTATYVAGFVRFSKQMMYNLPWLQTYLPQQLIRDFYIAENALFYAQLIAAATGVTTTTDGSVAGRLIQVIANLEGTNFTVNGMVVPPAIWAALMLTTVPTTGTSYSIPGGVQIMPNGQMMIAGIPIIKANWVTGPSANSTTYALVGDFTYAAIAQVENLKVEFFEQDNDNVEKNLITARVEALEVLVIEQPAAFASKLTSGNT